MTAPPDVAVLLAKMDVKLDQLLESVGDHEARLRKLEEQTSHNKNWQVVLANSLMTALNAILAGTTVITG